MFGSLFFAGKFDYSLEFARTMNADGTQTLQMDCRINSNEQVPEGAAPTGDPVPPFDPSGLIAAFVASPVIGQLQTLNLPGILIAPTIDITLFTFTTTLISGIVPGPSLQRTNTILIKNFGKFTSPFSTVVNGNIQYGVDITSINAIVSRLVYLCEKLNIS